MANEIAFTIKVNGAEKSVASIKEMEDELKQLETRFKSMKLGSAEFEKTKVELDAIKDKITNVKKSAETLSSESGKKAAEIKGKFQGMGMGIAESFGNAQQALSTFGIANDAAVKGVQNASIAVRAVTGVTKAYTIAQAALNIVMSLNPIGAIIVGVAALTAAVIFIVKPFREWISNLGFLKTIGNAVMVVLNKLRDWFAHITGLIDDTATAKAKKNAASMVDDFNKIGGAYDKMSEKQKQELELMEAKGASEDELHKKRAENIQNDINAQQEYLKNLKVSGAEPDKIAEAEKKLSTTRNELSKEDAANVTRLNKIKTDASIKASEEATAKEKEALKEREDAWKAYVERVKAEVEKSKGNIVTLINEQQNTLDERYLQSITDEDKREQEALRLKQERKQSELQGEIDYLNNLGVMSEEEKTILATKNAEMLQMIKTHEEEKTTLTVEQTAERTKKNAETERSNRLAAEELIMEDDEASFVAKRDASLARDAILLEDVNLSEGERNRIAAEGVAYRNALSLNEKEVKHQHLMETLQMFANATQAMMNLSDALFSAQLNNVKKGSKEELKIRKKQFATNKALSISMAVITGIMSALSAWDNGMKNPIPLLGPATAAVYMGISIVMSLAQIAKIASTKFDPGVSDSGGGEGGDSTPPPQPSKFARGGMVTGPGSSTSDSIPAMLSNGESVMNANSTRMFGGILSSMNQAGGGAPIENNSTDSTPIFKTYVVASDMTNQQEADKKITDLARI